MSTRSTEDIYDAHARNWAREERMLLSDFTARPFVIEELAPLAGTHVLDLGCGEGYVARLAAEAGAASVTGIDVSPEMVSTPAQRFHEKRRVPSISRLAMSLRPASCPIITSA